MDVYDTAHSWTAQVVDEIILPADTRKKIIEALELTGNKHEKLPQRAKGHSTIRYASSEHLQGLVLGTYAARQRFFKGLNAEKN